MSSLHVYVIIPTVHICILDYLSFIRMSSLESDMAAAHLMINFVDLHISKSHELLFYFGVSIKYTEVFVLN